MCKSSPAPPLFSDGTHSPSTRMRNNLLFRPATVLHTPPGWGGATQGVVAAVRHHSKKLQVPSESWTAGASSSKSLRRASFALPRLHACMLPICVRVPRILSTLSGFGLGLVCTIVCTWRLLRCGFGVSLCDFAMFYVAALLWARCACGVGLVSFRSAHCLGPVRTRSGFGVGLLCAHCPPLCGFGVGFVCA